MRCPAFRRLFPLLCGWAIATPVHAEDVTAPTAATEAAAATTDPAEPFRRFELVFEPDAYYADVALLVALSDAPIPQLGELSELDIYAALLSRAAVLPRNLVLEASVNPMPIAGVIVKKQARRAYDRAEVTPRFNLVKAITAGFEEPYAVSILAGSVANFSIAGKDDLRGLGYSGYLVSAGTWHIHDNALVPDNWAEFEWKLKGDRKSPVKKLSWSFRLGAKAHSNPEIADIFYVSLRRGRVDYQDEAFSLMRNTGFEYTVDFALRDLHPMRHYALVDRNWPIPGTQVALSLAGGLIWEAYDKYSGSLADPRKHDDFQWILRPNVQF